LEYQERKEMLLSKDNEKLDMREALLKINSKEDYDSLQRELFELFKNNKISKNDYKTNQKKIASFYRATKRVFSAKKSRGHKNTSREVLSGFNDDILEFRPKIKNLFLQGNSAYRIKLILDEQYSKNIDLTQLNLYIEKNSKYF
jgi:hypothetical protein